LTYRKRFRTKYLCSALVSAKTKGLKLDRINLLNYLDEGKLHFEKDGLGKYIIFKMFIKTFQKCSFLSISQVNDAFTLRGVNMGPWRSRSRSCG
jgi:hypothetical protein